MSAPRLQGKTAIVTGASRGIGAAIALDLASHGSAIVTNFLERRTEAEAVAARIRAAGGRAPVVQTDVADPTAVAAMVDEAVTTFGQLDILVNNAGIIEDRLPHHRGSSTERDDRPGVVPRHRDELELSALVLAGGTA